MRKPTRLKFLPLLFFLACVPSISAQDDAPQFKMPCQQVLKLGLDKFTDVYGDESLADKQKTYRESLKELKEAAAPLVARLPSMSDAAAQRAATRLLSELDTGLGQ